MPQSSPERDRHLSEQRRYGPRFADAVGGVARHWLQGPEGRRLRRHRHIVGALREVLGDELLERVEPVSVIKGTLTLAVSDPVLLSELRNLHHHALIGSLVGAGTGIGHVRYRIKRSG